VAQGEQQLKVLIRSITETADYPSRY